MPISGYGVSKVVGNFLFKWLALDNKDVIALSYDPGCVPSFFLNNFPRTLVEKATTHESIADLGLGK